MKKESKTKTRERRVDGRWREEYEEEFVGKDDHKMGKAKRR